MGHELLFVEYLFEFLVDVLTTQSSGEDGAIGGKEDGVGDSAEMIGTGSNPLSVDDLRVWNDVFLDGGFGVDRLVGDSYADNLEATVAVLIVGGDDSGNFLQTGGAP